MLKKAQALIIVLWVLVILTLLAVGIGHRVSLALRMSQYQKERLKTLYLAKAGVNQAIRELENDSNGYDSLAEAWSTTLFKDIEIESGLAETFSFSLEDEERKININSAPAGLILELLNKIQVSNSADVANNICAWRGDATAIPPDYADTGYSNKDSNFMNKEELVLVKDVDKETYAKIQGLVTTYGEGKVNINTALEELIEVLVEYARKNTAGSPNSADLAEKIFQARPFTDPADMQDKLDPLTSEQKNIVNEMLSVITFKSTCFSITSGGKMGESGLTSTIYSVFDREDKKQLYWHEG